VTMTTQEMTIFLGELGTIRDLMGQISNRLHRLETSVSTCQSRCTDERQRRLSWIHWTGGLFLALVPVAAAYYLGLKALP